MAGDTHRDNDITVESDNDDVTDSDIREIQLQRSHPAVPEHVETFSEWWEPTPIYCPECGVRTVWVEAGDGDYYQGPDFFCTSCLCTFTSPGGRSFEGNPESWKDLLRQRAAALMLE